MKKHWLTAPPLRTSRTVYTIVGSVLLHGSVIAVAALWPVHHAPSELPPQVTIIDPEPPGETVQLPPSSPEVNTDMPDDASGLVLVNDTSNDIPPPPEEPSMTEPAPPKPPSKIVVNKTRSPRVTVPVGTPGQPGTANLGARNAVGMAAGTGRPGVVGRWNTPQPPYPYAMRAARVQGNGSVRITTDGSGRVVSVGVAQSTGNAVLDANTSQFARANWSGPPNASVTVPITYQLR